MASSFSVFQAGPWAGLKKFAFVPPLAKELRIDGKVFLGERLGMQGGEVSLNRLAPGDGMPFFHRHQFNEELYVFVSGMGQMQIDDEIFDVCEGTAVRVSPKAARIWRNHSNDDLCFICFQYRVDSPTDREGGDALPVDRQVSWT
jgi:mannose-6-phosphate isomerase-like protein (cupin superfamily)